MEFYVVRELNEIKPYVNIELCMFVDSPCDATKYETISDVLKYLRETVDGEMRTNCIIEKHAIEKVEEIIL